MPSDPTPRALARERTMARIVELGNGQLRDSGVAGLSVREIARGLGMVSSAIYRYVASRDELLTLLIVDAYEDLAAAVEAALAGAGEAPRARFLALGSAMSRWALTQPERWTLLYGTPVPGYAAPAETTNAPGTRVMRAVLAIAADGARATEGPGTPALAQSVTSLLDEHLAEFGVEADPATAARAVTAWSGLVGVISAHVTGQLGPDAVALGEDLLRPQIEVLAELIAPLCIAPR
ncbi:TetR/AcrR family transcriptional regulator [Brachybacterium saurashtrense]|uniref:TetR/AcrR family transcriptional regulator n=1 Tax=Brachybacterium saurashtrense TaxID=556288 RepID=A0A345YLC9_9MICO|nr:TetR/AcrR family transcriptional regulator [Brachybacterium saurashtrense]AXK44731.1 TetR/AcrR family transcriptional regulator [Brachybacterium saurashtrense]RRR23343.1 TetR/AcrR family transcriptional regulator [Brachybacterium saurashtrense]